MSIFMFLMDQVISIPELLGISVNDSRVSEYDSSMRILR